MFVLHSDGARTGARASSARKQSGARTGSGSRTVVNSAYQTGADCARQTDFADFAADARTGVADGGATSARAAQYNAAFDGQRRADFGAARNNSHAHDARSSYNARRKSGQPARAQRRRN